MMFSVVLAGFGVGLLVGLTGVGGGALMTPILLLVFGTAPQTAIGTDLLFASITKVFGAGIHGLRNSIDWQVFRRLLSGSLPAAALTGLLLNQYGRTKAGIDVMLLALGCMLLVTGAGMWFKNQLHALGRRLRLGNQADFKHMQGPLTMAAGVFLGVMVTLTSVGAGALGAVFMSYLYPLRLTPAKLVGTDLAHAIPLALVAGAGHWMMGGVDSGLLGNLLIGSIPGVILGAVLGFRFSEVLLRRTIAVLLVIVGLKILIPFF